MKKYAIVYASNTGNTKKVAEAMAQARPEAFDIFDAKDNPDLSSYDLIVFGYGVDKGGPYAFCKKLMATIENKIVVLFHTLGAEPKTEHSLACAANGGASLGANCHIINHFDCQGAIDPKMIEMMRRMPAGSPHSATPENEARWAKAASHPDESDLARATAFMQKTLGMYENFYLKMMKKK